MVTSKKLAAASESPALPVVTEVNGAAPETSAVAETRDVVPHWIGERHVLLHEFVSEQVELVPSCALGGEHAAKANRSIEALSDGALGCVRQIFSLYAVGQDVLTASQWHRFCVDLLRQPASGEPLIPLSHATHLFERFCRLGPQATTAGPAEALRGVAPFILLLHDVAEYWSTYWNAPTTLASPDRGVLECLVRRGALPAGKASLEYLLDRIARYHLIVGETQTEQLGILRSLGGRLPDRAHRVAVHFKSLTARAHQCRLSTCAFDKALSEHLMLRT